jgi:hypothetical protein
MFILSSKSSIKNKKHVMKFSIKNIPNLSGNATIVKTENKMSNLMMYFLKFEILVKQRTKSNIIRIQNNIKLCSTVNKTYKALNL